ncbi:MAG: PAS domain S-box protein [Phreatobacter sp.]|uniref:sensor histidine kinase n=1 Tax=Phreatobacter sp. TaxID=1966341 RepID=UPI001A5FB3DF|nr:ATP-binding protein [Phreatobacter sp.]MBL8571870.1 PAS domain S-box protein [Phreatobacter sp.]
MPTVQSFLEGLATSQLVGLQRPRRRILLAMVGVLVPIWTIVALASFQQREAARSGALANSATVVKLVEAWALATLGRIDDLATSIEGHIAWGVEGRGISDILDRHKTNNPDLFRLTDVIAPDGTPIASTAPGHASLATRNYDSDNGPTTDVAIGLPRFVGDTVLVPMARTLRGPDGTALGTLVAEVDPSYFAGFYGDLGMPPGASVLLFRTDGPLIAHNIPSVGELGRSYPDIPIWRAVESRPDGSYQGIDIDGTNRLVSYRVNGRMPILVAIGLPSRTVYGQAHNRILVAVALTAILSIAVIAFGAATLRGLRRYDVVAKALALSAAGVRSAGSGIAILRLARGDAAIVQHNPAFVDLFGARRDGDLPAAWTRIAGPAALAWLPPAGDLAERRLEAEITRADGASFWAEIRAARVRDAGMGGDHVVVVVTDISERKHAEAALIQARDAAEAANRAKSEFLANMSHELRTPLNAVIGFADIIAGELMGPVGTPIYGAYARDISMSGNHLLGIISDILDFAKIEATAMRLDETDVEIGPLLETCLRFTQARAAAVQVVVEADYPDDLPLLRADELRIKQILLNLLSNAIKFSPARRTVRLVARVNGLGGLEISVVDQGPGMTAAEIRLAEQPFQQIDNPANKRTEGTGLGLPLAKRLAELHGGDLVIESVPGRGTCVTLFLGADRLHAAAAPDRRERRA